MRLCITHGTDSGEKNVVMPGDAETKSWKLEISRPLREAPVDWVNAQLSPNTSIHCVSASAERYCNDVDIKAHHPSG